LTLVRRRPLLRGRNAGAAYRRNGTVPRPLPRVASFRRQNGSVGHRTTRLPPSHRAFRVSESVQRALERYAGRFSQKARSSGSPAGWVEAVAQPISKEIEAKHGEENGEAWENAHPPCSLKIGTPIGQHAAPAWNGRIDTEAEEGQA